MSFKNVIRTPAHSRFLFIQRQSHINPLMVSQRLNIAYVQYISAENFNPQYLLFIDYNYYYSTFYQGGQYLFT